MLKVNLEANLNVIGHAIENDYEDTGVFVMQTELGWAVIALKELELALNKQLEALEVKKNREALKDVIDSKVKIPKGVISVDPIDDNFNLSKPSIDQLAKIIINEEQEMKLNIRNKKHKKEDK